MNSNLRVQKVNVNLVDDHRQKLISWFLSMVLDQLDLKGCQISFYCPECFKCNRTMAQTVCIVEYSLMNVWDQRQWVIFTIRTPPHTHLQTVTGHFQHVMVSMCEWGNYTMSFTMTILFGSFDSDCKPFPVYVGIDPSYTYSLAPSNQKTVIFFHAVQWFAKHKKKQKQLQHISQLFLWMSLIPFIAFEELDDMGVCWDWRQGLNHRAIQARRHPVSFL